MHDRTHVSHARIVTAAAEYSIARAHHCAALIEDLALDRMAPTMIIVAEVAALVPQSIETCDSELIAGVPSRWRQLELDRMKEVNDAGHADLRSKLARCYLARKMELEPGRGFQAIRNANVALREAGDEEGAKVGRMILSGRPSEACERFVVRACFDEIHCNRRHLFAGEAPDR
jgi:hypothetical protein